MDTPADNATTTVCSNKFINFYYSNTHKINVNHTKCFKRVSIDLRIVHDKLVNFSLYITDDSDPYYLFLCDLDQEAYTLYKENYNINIPFDQFPKQIIKFLNENNRDNDNVDNIELVIVEDSKKRASGDFVTKETHVRNKENILDNSLPLDYTKQHAHSRSPLGNESTPQRYFAKSPSQEEVLYFKIIEKNDFRALTLLKMKIKKATNSDMKHFFNNRINKLTSYIDLKNKNEITSSDKIRSLECRIEQMQSEIDRLNCQNREEKDAISRQIDQKYDHMLKEKSETIQKKNDKINELQTDKNRIVEENKRLNSVINDLKDKNKVIPELNEKLKAKNKKLESYETDIKVYQNKSKKCQQDLQENEKFIASLRMRLAVLEQESGDKQVLLEKLQDMIKLSNENKNQLENNLKNRDEINSKKYESINVLKKELIKANEIISKITHENTELNKKLGDLRASYNNLKHLYSGQLNEIKEYKTSLDLKESDLSNLMESKKQIYMKFMNTEHELKMKIEKLTKYEKCLNAIKSYLEKINKNSKNSLIESEIIVFLKDILVTIS
uniref:Spindle assembly abnormal protein 6 homolog n=1 Tax=Cacopsylla melanoneura TaxID=428564 RepID=A0A8D8YYG4_9HEMI